VFIDLESHYLCVLVFIDLESHYLCVLVFIDLESHYLCVLVFIDLESHYLCWCVPKVVTVTKVNMCSTTVTVIILKYGTSEKLFLN
jgi:hypothetical protein